MKFIGADIGQCFWLFPFEEVRPLTGFFLPHSVQEICNRYEFQFPPTMEGTWDEIRNSPFKFGSGRFRSKEEEINISELIVYSDGISISSTFTEHAERVLIDLLDWAVSSLGARELISSPKKHFRSQIVVEFEKDMNSLLNGFLPVLKSYSSLMEKHYGVSQPGELFKLGINCDKSKIPSNIISTDFVIERRFTNPYEDERFIADAPLPTQEHIVFLETIERAIQDR